MRRYIPAIAVVLLISACGGGSDDSPPVSPTPSPAPTNPNLSTQTIDGASGGTAGLSSIGSVKFPAGVLATPTTVTLEKTQADQIADAFGTSAVLFDTAIRASYEFKIGLESSQPTGPVEVTLTIPDDLKQRMTAEDEIRVMHLNVYDDGNEHLETVELQDDVRADVSAPTITTTLPAEAFFDDGTGHYVAYVFLALTPTKTTTTAQLQRTLSRFLANVTPIRSASAADECNGTSLSPPVDPTTLGSGFGPRKAPKAGASTNHKGVDFAVPAGTEVHAAQDGILHIGQQRDKKTGDYKGWGYYVYITQKGSGATLYAHLTDASAKVADGTAVKAGDVIAVSGNTGTGTGPHLHFEYAPSGKIFTKDAKKDPLPCLGKLSTGALTVSDNGNVADDAFEVKLNNTSVCRTAVGQANNCTLSGLKPGKYTLTLTAIVAPDNVGTYLIVINAPNMTINGAKSDSGNLPLNGTVVYTLEVTPPATTLP